MKILNVQQFRAAIELTRKNQLISNESLIERSAQKCRDWIVGRVNKSTKISIFSGFGNNGDDGIALARLLYDATYEVDLYLVGYNGVELSKDIKENLRRLKRRDIKIHHIDTRRNLPTLSPSTIIIDCLFGIGVNRPLEGIFASTVNFINEIPNSVLSVDVPSGLKPEGVMEGEWPVIRADFTITFQCPKLNFLFAETGEYVGNMEILDINLDLSESDQNDMCYFQSDTASRDYKSRCRFSHKGTYGHSLIIGGSEGMIGSVFLAAKASLRTGSGLSSCYVPRCGLDVLQISLPEAIVIPDVGDRSLHEIKYNKRYSSIGIGIGMGQGQESKEALINYLKEVTVPIVIDADALNIISEMDEGDKILPDGCIVTPHVKEFKRLVGGWEDDYDKLEKIKHFAITNKCTVVFKDAYTIVCNQAGQLCFNSTGNAGMATAGSGDVLTGILTGLLAQGYSPEVAARLGVFLHGKAGDIATKESSIESIVATDIINSLGKAYKKISTHELYR